MNGENKNVLDEPEVKSNYAKRAGVCAFSLIILFGLQFLLVWICNTLSYPTSNLIYSFIIYLALIPVGSFYSFKSRKEKNSFIKIFGMIINFTFLLVFISMLVINIFDLYRVMN